MICETINVTLKNKVRNDSKLKLKKTMAKIIFIYNEKRQK